MRKAGLAWGVQAKGFWGFRLRRASGFLFGAEGFQRLGHVGSGILHLAKGEGPLGASRFRHFRVQG